MCVCILAGLYGCAQTTLCVNSSLVVVVGGGIPLCVCVCVCVCWLMGSQQGARPTYTPSYTVLLFLPPITLFHPRLIWQRRRRRAGARVTKGHCTSSNITLSVSCHLVSLLCPHFSLLPVRYIPPPHTFVSVLTFPASLVAPVFLTLRDRAYNFGDARHLVIFVLRYSVVFFFSEP